MIISQTQLTLDTDDSRPNNYPAVAVDVSGRTVIVYEKTLTSGRLSDSRVSQTPPFTVNVQAGNGSLNGSAVSWVATDLVMPPSTFQVIYVTSGGTVTFVDSLTMTLMASSIILAFVYVGASAITEVEEVEKTGKYIYVRSQISSGGNWVWDNKEYILNTGEQPKAYYDIATDNIYLSYKKDNISYVRVLDFSNTLTLSYIPNISINTGIINLNNNPQNTLYVSSGSGYEATTSAFVTPKLFLPGYTALKFIPVLSVQQPHIYMPFVTSSGGYLPYMRLPYYVEIFSYNGSSYVLEESVAVSDNTSTDIIKDIPLRWHQWTGSLGQKYLGLRIYNTLFTDPYLSEPSDYLPLYVFSAYEGHQTVGNTIYSYIVEKTVDINSMSAGYEGVNPVTYQYDILYDMENQYPPVPSSAGYQADVPLTTFDQLSGLESETIAPISSAGYNVSVVIT